MSNFKLQQLTHQFGLNIVPLSINKDTRISDPFNILFIYGLGFQILTVNGTFLHDEGKEDEIISDLTENFKFFTDNEGCQWVKHGDIPFPRLVIQGMWFEDDEDGAHCHTIRVCSTYLSSYFNQEGLKENYDSSFYYQRSGRI